MGKSKKSFREKAEDFMMKVSWVFLGIVYLWLIAIVVMTKFGVWF